MDIRELGIIQDELRNVDQIAPMIKFIRDGGSFDVDTIANWEMADPRQGMLMEIACFPDGKCYIHNGHHRAVALYLGHRYIINQTEYYIKEWEYSDYDDIVFLNPDGSWRGYVTPFDIRTETRAADLGTFKDDVKDYYYNLSKRHAETHIQYSGKLYKRPKTLFSVEELAQAYKEGLQHATS